MAHLSAPLVQQGLPGVLQDDAQLDIILKRTVSEQNRERMVCVCVCVVNPFGQPGSGLFKDKVNKHIVCQVHEILDALGISAAKDLDIQKQIFHHQASTYKNGDF